MDVFCDLFVEPCLERVQKGERFVVYQADVALQEHRDRVVICSEGTTAMQRFRHHLSTRALQLLASLLLCLLFAACDGPVVNPDRCSSGCNIPAIGILRLSVCTAHQ